MKHAIKIYFVLFLLFSTISATLHSKEILSKQKSNHRNEMNIPSKCGTITVRDIKSNWGALSKNEQRQYESLLARPLMQHQYNTADGHFKIHYNTSGSDIIYQPAMDTSPNDGHPDFVNRIGNYMEYVRHILIDSLEYDAPPPDGGRGGDYRYDIYMKSFEGAYGVTFFDFPSTLYPGRNAYSSYLSIHPNFQNFPNTPDESAQVTAVHEFFHAVQFAYDAWEDSWFMEASATWIEDIVYDDVNDYYNYLSAFFSQPELSLTSLDGVHEYASCIWPHFLSQKFGLPVMRDIWTNCISLNSIRATEKVLNETGDSLPNAFSEFTLWNYFTGIRTNKTFPHYIEAENYPIIAPQAIHRQYPISEHSMASGFRPDHLSCNYIHFYSDSMDTQKLFRFTGSNLFDWQLNALSVTGNSTQKIDFNNKHKFVFPRDQQDIVVIPAVTSTSGIDADYSYSVKTFASGSLLFDLESISATDIIAVDGNDRIEPGETGQFTFSLKNYGEATSGVQVIFRSDHPEIHILDSLTSFPYVEENSVINNLTDPFTFSISPIAESGKLTCELLVISSNTSSIHLPTDFIVGFPSLLLIQQGSETSMYTKQLDLVNPFYDVVYPENELNQLYLEKRETVLWAAGENGYEREEITDSLVHFLQSGKNLLITGGNFSASTKTTSFLESYTGCQFSGRTQSDMLVGSSGEFISQGRFSGFNTRGTFKDKITPGSHASVIFNYANENSAAGCKFEGNHKVIFYSFPLHQLVSDHTNLMSPEQILERSLQWFNTETSLSYSTAETPKEFTLEQNFPNPFNQGTIIRFSVPDASSNVSLKIYNIKGEHVRTLLDGNLQKLAGTRQYIWNGEDAHGNTCVSGTYFAKLSTELGSMSRKIVLIK